MQDWTDHQLLAKYAKGSQDAFGVLMNRHSAQVKAFALRMLRNAERAEDVCSETFLRVAMNKGAWEDRGYSFKSYLFRIANNLCIDIIRRHKVARKSAQGVLELTLHQQLKPSPEADVILGERASILETAIGALSEEHRQVVVLRSIHGLSARETADIIGCAPGQVDSRLSYARKKLRDALADLSESARKRGVNNA